ncbi:uncharacterized protein isoform X1 [Danio rerio]|uniref:non-specific serine/threonine protein kinase n=1 Tax=Danio rerio TaxID=7955 RepID=A0A8M9PCE9_DANRE
MEFSVDRDITNIQFAVDNNSLEFGKKHRTMGRVRKRVKQFCNWASRKSGKAQQNQCTSEGDLEHRRCSDVEAGPSNATFISHIHTGAGVSPSPAPQTREKKLKRLWKWFSRKFKRTRTRAPQGQLSSPQPQRSPDGEAACVSPRTVHDERVNRRVSIQTPVKTPSTETERHDDTECWDFSVSSLSTAGNSESDRASVHSWHSCASSLGTPVISESDRASVLSWHSCASSLGTAGISESDRASVHSRHPCESSLTAEHHNDEENASSEDSSVSEDSTSSSSDFWKTEQETTFNWEGNTGRISQDYKIHHLIGQGSTGVIYDGIRLSDCRMVDIKCVKKSKSMERITIEPSDKTVPREVGLMIMMSRGPKVPQVIQLLDWYEAPDRYILVLEHPKSAVSLDQFVSSCGNKISEAKARVVMHQVITAANACCERGVYNNIKLESLLINPHTLQVKLMDFGTGSLIKDSGYTKFWGSIACIPPEFYQKGRFHAKPAIVYSLGKLLFRMLCGHYPHMELHKIVKRTWQPEDLSKEAVDLICSCLQTKPDKRPLLDEILHQRWFQVFILKPNNRRKD